MLEQTPVVLVETPSVVTRLAVIAMALDLQATPIAELPAMLTVALSLTRVQTIFRTWTFPVSEAVYDSLI